jgi:CRISPR-associated protein Csm2
MAKTAAAKKFADVLSIGVKAVVDGKDNEEKKQRFQYFADFFESILAYHKAHGGN